MEMEAEMEPICCRVQGEKGEEHGRDIETDTEDILRFRTLELCTSIMIIDSL